MPPPSPLPLPWRGAVGIFSRGSAADLSLSTHRHSSLSHIYIHTSIYAHTVRRRSPVISIMGCSTRVTCRPAGRRSKLMAAEISRPRNNNARARVFRSLALSAARMSLPPDDRGSAYLHRELAREVGDR